MNFKNPGFDPNNIEKLKNELIASGKSFKIIPDEENSEEFVNFYFLGKYEGKDVIYDAALYTLSNYQEDEDGNMQPLSAEEEEIGWFITELIMEMEEEETVKVQEFIDLDTHHDFGIGLDAALNVEVIDDQVIRTFI